MARLAKKRYSFNEQTKARYESEGRGLGTGPLYKPWLDIQSVPSVGRVHRQKGIKTGRIHQLLSDIEYRLLLLLDWSEGVIDIREQFPLDRDQTMQLADALRCRHPRDPDTRVLTVMTTDFLVDLSVGGQRFQRAYAVKPSAKLADGRILEKLEIERRYWERLGVDWKIVTELDLPSVWVGNVEWVHNHFWLDPGQEPYEGFYRTGSIAIVEALDYELDQTVADFCEAMDLQLRCGAGTSLNLLRHLLATRTIEMPTDRTVNAKTRISAFKPVGQRQALSA